MAQSHTSRFEAVWRFLQRHTMIVLTVLFAGGAGIVFWYNARASRQLGEATMLRDAELYAQALAEFRTLYTSEVVETVRANGVVVTHDYKHTPGAIPLPATLSLLLGERIGQHADGAQARLYSPFPFPWRADTGGLRDDFAKAAWSSLEADPTVPFYRFEKVDGDGVLRYATADLMRSSCVSCHNSHADSPKRDWKEGELRGVLEVAFPMDEVESQTAASLKGSLAVMGSLLALGLAFLGVVIARLRNTTASLQANLDRLEVSEAKARSANEDLVVARDEAMAAFRAKSRFLQSMSHELLTPLNAIIGYNEVAQEEAEDAGQTEVLSDLVKIHKASILLLRMIEDVLEYSRVDAGDARLSVHTFSIGPLVEDVVEQSSASAAENNDTLEVVVAEDLATMTSDRAKLGKCLRNLVSNAVKFTEDGVVRVEVTSDEDHMVFRISDTGIGMSPERIDELFGVFTQADGSITRKYGGAGLGLSLTRALVGVLGGTLSVDSEPEKGSTFTIRVPADISALVDELE